MCCAAVAADVCAGPAGSGEGAPSAFCSGACGVESLLESGDLTGGQTGAGLGLDLRLLRMERHKRCIYTK